MNCPQPSGPFSIFTGDAKVMPLRLAYANGLPVDLTSCTEIVVNLVNADGSITQLKLSVGGKVAIVSPPVLGQFNVTIDPAVSALLQIGELQSIDVTFTITNPFTIRFYQALSVFETE